MNVASGYARRRSALTARAFWRFSLLVILPCMPALLWAQTPAKPPLTDLFQSIATENYAQAREQAELFLQLGTPEEQQKAALAYGRVLLALGEKEPARKYLKLMAKQDLPEGESLAEVYQAWLQFLDGKPDAAVKALEAKLKKNGRSLATAEAADVLATLYLARGERDKAQKAVDFGLGMIKYASLQTDYTEALLRLRMQHKADSAEKLYEAAEKLRLESKFLEAGSRFVEIVQQYPKSEWVDPARFRAGQCLVGLGQIKEALEHWKKFIADKPRGPWRGQAHVAMIDTALEFNLDSATATEHALAATVALGKSLDMESASSWQEAAYEIHLRQGIVSLVDGRYEAAAAGFKQAQQNLATGKLIATGDSPRRDVLEKGLERLRDAAERRAAILPAELLAGNAHSVLALAVGNTYLILPDYEAARRFFNIPLAGRGRSGSPTHRSFAAFGLARITARDTQNRAVEKRADDNSQESPFEPVKALYQQSLKEYPKGSWHDETLRELALIVEREAALRFQPIAGTAKHPPDKAANADGDLVPKAARSSEAERRQQAKQLAAARAKALPLWIDLPKRYPVSQHVPQSLYHAGVLYAEAQKPDDALNAFEELTNKYPDSPWTGDAQVWLIDVKLEQQFDLDGAAKLAHKALTWYEKLDAAQATKARKAFAKDEADDLHTLQQVGYDIYLRSGLIEYLQDHRGQSLTFFEKAEPLEPNRGRDVVGGHIPSGIERLIRLVKSDRSLAPELARQGDNKAKLILMLADVYHEGRQHAKVVQLCTRIATSTDHNVSREQKSYAYFRRGRSNYLRLGAKFDPDAALADYTAAVTLAPKSPWADAALFFVGNIQWNHNRNPPAAIAIWERLLRDYPHSVEADRCLLYIGAVQYHSQHYTEARRSLNRFLKAYPKSEFTDTARRLLSECGPKMGAQARDGIKLAPTPTRTAKGR